MQGHVYKAVHDFMIMYQVKRQKWKIKLPEKLFLFGGPFSWWFTFHFNNDYKLIIK